jgi:hypothetical protein
VKIAEKMVFPTMTDPVSGAKLKEGDIIKLRSAESGFAAGGAKDVGSFRPNMGF